MSISRQVADSFPGLAGELRRAGLVVSPADYVKKNLKSSLILSLFLALLLFFTFSKKGLNPLVVLFAFVVFFMFFFSINMQSMKVKILRMAKKIDRDVLFAGRFLLVKLRSGKPLVNSIMDASKSYGVANEFFREVVRDIELGTPLEKALEDAAYYCPSEKFRRIFFQINNALKIGVDVTGFLEAILDDIANEQLIEIQRYGKKLNGMTMFYMLLAVVMPSLGVSLLIILSSMIAMPIGIELYLVIGFFMLIIEFAFISIFRNIRPNVNI